MLAYFGFRGCSESCPPALNRMQALDAVLLEAQRPQLDRVFVDLAGDTSQAHGSRWLGDYANDIRYLAASPELRETLARRFSLRLYPTPDGEPWHADAYLLAERLPDNRWRATVHHGRLPTSQIKDALAKRTANKEGNPS